MDKQARSVKQTENFKEGATFVDLSVVVDYNTTKTALQFASEYGRTRGAFYARKGLIYTRIVRAWFADLKKNFLPFVQYTIEFKHVRTCHERWLCIIILEVVKIGYRVYYLHIFRKFIFYNSQVRWVPNGQIIWIRLIIRFGQLYRNVTHIL